MSKKFAATALAGVFVLLIAGCSAGESASPEPEAVVEESQSEQPAPDGQEDKEADASIGVDEGFLTVDVTLPAEFYEGSSDEEIAQSVEEEGYSDFVRNPDGSVTFTMPKRVWEEALEDMKRELDVAVQDIVNEYPDTFKSVTYDNDVTEFDVVVNRAAYESNPEAQWVGFGLNFQSLFYQLFVGVPADERGGAVRLIDEANGEVFDTQEWPVSG